MEEQPEQILCNREICLHNSEKKCILATPRLLEKKAYINCLDQETNF